MRYRQQRESCNGWIGSVLLLLALSVGQCAATDLETARLIDLTHPFDETTIYWPTARHFQLEVVAHGETPGGWWYAANNFCAAEHGGTHMDAPIHFAEGHWTADEIPLERLVGPAVVIDLRARVATDRDALLRVQDLEADETRNGRIPDAAIVLVRTGWPRYWPDPATYLGTAVPGDTTHLHFPGVSGEAATWLVTRRRIHAVGIDTASIDRGQSRDFLAHRAFGSANVPIFENLAALDTLPARGAVFVGLPMKIRGGSGGPLRAMAVLP
jgi:kynurenine formamidase